MRKAKCDCPLDDPDSMKCHAELQNLFDQFGKDMKTYMNNTSESNAYAISDPCCMVCRIIYK